MGRHCKRHQRALGKAGQSTLEYALVTVAVLAVVLCFGAVVEAVSDGALAEQVLSALARKIPDGVADVLMF